MDDNLFFPYSIFTEYNGHNRKDVEDEVEGNGNYFWGIVKSREEKIKILTQMKEINPSKNIICIRHFDLEQKTITGKNDEIDKNKISKIFIITKYSIFHSFGYLLDLNLEGKFLLLTEHDNVLSEEKKFYVSNIVLKISKFYEFSGDLIIRVYPHHELPITLKKLLKEEIKIIEESLNFFYDERSESLNKVVFGDILLEESLRIYRNIYLTTTTIV